MVKWNLYTDASLSSGSASTPVVPCGLAAILQKADDPTQERIFMESVMGWRQSSLMEIRALQMGLKLSDAGDIVRVFLDNHKAFAALFSCVKDTSTAAQVDQFLESLEPLDFREKILAIFHGNSDPSLSHLTADIYSFEPQDVRLTALRAEVRQRVLSFTKVHDMKTPEGREQFPDHVRCDDIATRMRHRQLGSAIKQSPLFKNLPFPFGPRTSDHDD